jgi:phage repressor protein C with HTH and peptisase S24 domain
MTTNWGKGMIVTNGKTGSKRAVKNKNAERQEKLRRSERTSEQKELATLLGQRVVEELTRGEELLKPTQVAQWLATITGQSRAATTAWKAGKTLPDLLSFKRLVDGVNIDAYYLLGLSDKAKSPIPVLKTVGEEKIQLKRMLGDDMAQVIADGQLMAVDITVAKLAGNGIYLLKEKNSEFVRRIEKKPTAGIEMSYDNTRYKSMAFDSESAMRAKGIQVLGKIVGVVKGV